MVLPICIPIAQGGERGSTGRYSNHDLMNLPHSLTSTIQTRPYAIWSLCLQIMNVFNSDVELILICRSPPRKRTTIQMLAQRLPGPCSAYNQIICFLGDISYYFIILYKFYWFCVQIVDRCWLVKMPIRRRKLLPRTPLLWKWVAEERWRSLKPMETYI